MTPDVNLHFGKGTWRWPGGEGKKEKEKMRAWILDFGIEGRRRGRGPKIGAGPFRDRKVDRARGQALICFRNRNLSEMAPFAYTRAFMGPGREKITR